MKIIPEKKCFKNPPQLIKFIILFICGVFTCSQVAQCFQKFIHPPASTHSEFILNNSIRYPCVTICRRPAYKTQLFSIYNISGSLISSNSFRYFNFSKHTLTEFFQNTTYDFHEIFGQYAYGSRGYSMDFTNEQVLNIKSSFHFERGRCFTFEPLRQSETFSITGGYVFFLFHNNTHQHLNEYGVSTHGFQIYLHDPNEDVTYHEDERNNFLEILNMEASEDMRVKFEIQEFGRIPTKDNYCKQEVDYSKSKCEELCLNEQIARAANCTAPFLWLSEDDNDLPECSSVESIRALIRDYTKHRNTILMNCNCPMACNFTVFKTSILNRRAIESLLAPNSMFCLYTTNLFFRMSEVLGYDWNQLLSDIGGSMGFLLGLSVISLICLFEEIFKLIFKWMFKKKNKQDTTETNNHSDEIKSTLTPENKHDANIEHEYKNINEFFTDYNFYKKNSEYNESNNNNNNTLKY